MRYDSTTLVIFGITGDLAKRKLLPALKSITQAGLLPPTRIIGISRRDVSADALLHEVFGDEPDAARDALAGMLTVFTMDLAQQSEYERLREYLAARSSGSGASAQTVLYLSVPPAATLPIVESLGEAGLNDPATVKLLLEKPFGVDLASAEDSIETIGRYFQESQLYRIDHYLAKEMAQNIVAFRSHNAIFRNLWDGQFVERIDIVASEKIGIEGRAAFYEQTGALRDFLQNHLMQLLALTIMDIPSGFSASDMPAARLAALRSLLPIRPEQFGSLVHRGQYAGYADEVANPGSQTETFVSMTLHSSDSRWQNVPFRLATGKNLAEQTTEIRVYFRQHHEQEANVLVLHMQPKEGIDIMLRAKKPGYEKEYEDARLHFNYRQQHGQAVEAYERVLLDAFSSDKSLFTSADEVLASWRILEPVQDHWAMHTDDMRIYQPGTPVEELLTER